MNDILVLKLGGMFLHSDTAIHNFFTCLKDLYKRKNKKILIVHGGEFLAKKIFYNTTVLKENDFFANYSYENNINNYHKVSIFHGIINSFLLKYANLYDIPVIGLRCTDENMIVIKKKVGTNDFDFHLNSRKLLEYFLDRQVIPIISPCGITQDNLLINLDSDIVSMLLTKLLYSKLIVLTDVSGVLNGKGREIKQLNLYDSDRLIREGVINQGMIVKVQSALEAAKYTKNVVKITSWLNLSTLKQIFYNDTIGTSILYE
ncbi:hypothetical protein [Buchnera aphidicola]|uniref:amino acid kinase family protein n=1 Tax=Buchnera aphidicola TaxID=9 RepID=UPI0031B8A32D